MMVTRENKSHGSHGSNGSHGFWQLVYQRSSVNWWVSWGILHRLSQGASSLRSIFPKPRFRGDFRFPYGYGSNLGNPIIGWLIHVNTKNRPSVISQVFDFDPYPYLMTLEEMQLKNSIENYAELRARSDALQVRMAFDRWFFGGFYQEKWGYNGDVTGNLMGLSIEAMNSPAMMFWSEHERVVPKWW